MGYCTAEDVYLKLQNDLDATTQPLATKIPSLIAEVTSEINLRLSSKNITSPATNADMLNVCKKYCSFEVASIVLQSYLNNNSDVENTQADYYHKQYLDFLNDIAENPENYKSVSNNSGSSPLSNNVLDGTFTESEINDLMYPSKVEV